MSRHPIADYALLSDCRSAVLVHRSGSVVLPGLADVDLPRGPMAMDSGCFNLLGKDEGHGLRKKANADYLFYATVTFMREFLLLPPHDCVEQAR